MADYTSPDIARWTPPPPEWRLPVMTSNLPADWRAAHEAHRHATEPWQDRACVLRISQLAERQAAETAARLAAIHAAAASIGRAAEEVGRQLRLMVGIPTPRLTQRDVALVPPRPRPGPAGPPRTPRAPRTIGRPSTGPRR